MLCCFPSAAIDPAMIVYRGEGKHDGACTFSGTGTVTKFHLPHRTRRIVYILRILEGPREEPVYMVQISHAVVVLNTP